jgi:hypothetical protein
MEGDTWVVSFHSIHRFDRSHVQLAAVFRNCRRPYLSAFVAAALGCSAPAARV